MTVGERPLTAFLLITVGAAAATGAALGVFVLLDEDPPADAKPAATVSATPATPSPERATPWVEPEREPEPDFNQPVMVNVISSPATGGDPSSTFCISWTGSESEYGRDAVLLMNTPGYQCAADLVTSTDGQVHGPYGVFYEVATECAAEGTYPAVLQGAWDSTFYACLNDHTGA